MDASKATVYSIITDQIIALLDKGTVPWQKTWRGYSDRPVNAKGIPYRGINTFILSVAKLSGGYTSNFWVTPNQARKMGGSVRKGEHTTMITFWNVGQKKVITDEDGNTKVTRPFMLRYYRVVNIEQCEDIKLTKKMSLEASLRDNEYNDAGRIDEAEAILASYLVRDDAPKFSEGGDRAFYLPREDSITVPARGDHFTIDNFYATAFHEVGHSTGHETRCKREGVVGFDHFGSDQYAREELVAEMTSAMLCGDSGIDSTIENSAAYIASWKSKLQDDPKLVITAAGQAQKAVDYIIGTRYETEDE